MVWCFESCFDARDANGASVSEEIKKKDVPVGRIFARSLSAYKPLDALDPPLSVVADLLRSVAMCCATCTNVESASASTCAMETRKTGNREYSIQIRYRVRKNTARLKNKFSPGAQKHLGPRVLSRVQQRGGRELPCPRATAAMHSSLRLSPEIRGVSRSRRQPDLQPLH